MTKSKANTAPANAGVVIMDAAAITRAVRRMAHEIVEANPDAGTVVLAGVPSRGNEIAQRRERHDRRNVLHMQIFLRLFNEFGIGRTTETGIPSRPGGY